VVVVLVVGVPEAGIPVGLSSFAKTKGKTKDLYLHCHLRRGTLARVSPTENKTDR